MNYNIFLLGLIVTPTAIINGTPLDCNLCQNKNCLQFFSHIKSIIEDPPDYNRLWVKKYCTMTAVDAFILYFPYFLLIMALVLVMTERVFLRIFKAGLKLNAFYGLIIDDNNTQDEDEVDSESARHEHAIEVLYSFASSSSYFYTYLVRTLFQTATAICLLLWLAIHGVPSIQKEEFIYCDVYGTPFECAGHPQQFYMYVLFTTLLILIFYIFCCVYNLLWLIFPQMGELSRVMGNYRSESLKIHGSDEKGLGDLLWIYYKNRDLKLLLDLLAASSGVAKSVSLLTIFDSNLKIKAQPSFIEIKKEGESLLTVEISEAEIAKSLIFKHFTCVYTIKIDPPIQGPHVRAIKFKNKKIKENKTELLRSRNHKFETKCVSFKITIENTEKYTICISTLLNGYTIFKNAYSIPTFITNEL